ncbi:MAG: T9SS type A sorting domain-containing protein [Bacteroidales bacterium]|nr:T9SS type A sorting domain-containing protein [Bacteroidales bacterium]
MAQVQTVRFDLSGGIFMGDPIPDYTKWYYFSFSEGDTIGSSAGTLENVNPGNVGTEVINADWKARTDWDIAFHATDIRTNSGASGNGNAGSLKIADTTTVADLATLFTDLTEAPDATYKADEMLTGTFIFGMTGMPPLRTTQISASAAAIGWATMGMNGDKEVPTVMVFKTADDRYVKVLLRRFFDDDGKPGVIEFDYEYIPLTVAIATVETSAVKLYPNPVSNYLTVELTANESAHIAIYSLTGALVSQLNTTDKYVQIPVSDWAKGSYIVKVNTRNSQQSYKIVIK